jgi:hypothetical protein
VEVLGVEVPPAAVEEKRVVDVPAIDMTDQSPVGDGVAEPPVVAERGTKRRRGPAKSRAASSKSAKTASRKRRSSGGDATAASSRPSTSGSSSAGETVQAVDKLVSAGASKTEAFKQVAKQRGRTAGTVANSYYRAVRQSGGSAAGSKQRQRQTQRSGAGATGTTRQQGTRRGARGAGAASDIDHLAQDVISTLSQLTEVVAQQSRELAELRARVDGVRRRLH